MNKLIKITKIALLTIILAEEVRKARELEQLKKDQLSLEIKVSEIKRF